LKQHDKHQFIFLPVFTNGGKCGILTNSLFPGGKTMTLPEMKKFRWNYVALAFGGPTGLMLIVIFLTSVAPFG
jgi:hypothetical protein